MRYPQGRATTGLLLVLFCCREEKGPMVTELPSECEGASVCTCPTLFVSAGGLGCPTGPAELDFGTPCGDERRAIGATGIGFDPWPKTLELGTFIDGDLRVTLKPDDQTYQCPSGFAVHKTSYYWTAGGKEASRSVRGTAFFLFGPSDGTRFLVTRPDPSIRVSIEPPPGSPTSAECTSEGMVACAGIMAPTATVAVKLSHAPGWSVSGPCPVEAATEDGFLLRGQTGTREYRCELGIGARIQVRLSGYSGPVEVETASGPVTASGGAYFVSGGDDVTLRAPGGGMPTWNCLSSTGRTVEVDGSELILTAVREGYACEVVGSEACTPPALTLGIFKDGAPLVDSDPSTPDVYEVSSADALEFRLGPESIGELGPVLKVDGVSRWPFEAEMAVELVPGLEIGGGEHAFMAEVQACGDPVGSNEIRIKVQ